MKAVPVRVRRGKATLAIILAIWMFVRVFPLAAFPGLYSYDAWNHLGYCLALVQSGHIPLVNYANYIYYVHPAMHILALMLYYYLGFPLGICLQILTILLPFVLFLTFYVFLRAILKVEWQVQTGMLVVGLSPDVLAQSNAALPEALGLSFMALGFALIVKMVRQRHAIVQNSVLLSIVTISLYLAHHLATVMFCLGCIALCICLLALRSRRLWRIGLPATVLPAATGLILLLVFDPFMQGFLRILLIQYTVFPILLVLVASLAIVLGPKILGWMERIRARTPSSVLAIFGFGLAAALLAVLVRLYPTPRPVEWVLYKFMPLIIVVTLAVVATFRLPDRKKPGTFELVSSALWLGALGMTFLVFTVFAFARPASWNLLTIEASLAIRHFTYITIAATPLACSFLALYMRPLGYQQNKGARPWRRACAVGLVVLVGCTLALSTCNLYAPAGGWYRTWFDDSEIEAAFWLSAAQGPASTIATDARLKALFRGVDPYLPSNHTVIPLNSSYLSNPSRPGGIGNSYYFVTDSLEQQFMPDFATLPAPFACRDIFDTANSLSRIYSSTYVTIYHVAPRT